MYIVISWFLVFTIGYFRFVDDFHQWNKNNTNKNPMIVQEMSKALRLSMWQFNFRSQDWKCLNSSRSEDGLQFNSSEP